MKVTHYPDVGDLVPRTTGRTGDAQEERVRAAAERIMAAGSGATTDARTVAAAWLAEHPAADGGSRPEIEDTPGANSPDA